MIDSFHNVFLTRGARYIVLHTCVELLNFGVVVTDFDNFCNNQTLALARVAQINGKKPTLVQGDIIQESATFVITLRPIPALEIINFVGLKSVDESVQKPLTDHDNNVAGCLNLFQVF